MWFRIGEEACVPRADVVGLFTPESVEGFGKDENARVVVVLRDGRTLPSPFGPKVLAKRFREGRL